MNTNNENKKYVSVKIPERNTLQNAASSGAYSGPQKDESSEDSGIFYEIEYGSFPIPGVGRFVSKPLLIKAPEKDDIRELFMKMREIKCQYPFSYNANHFYDKTVQRLKAETFFKQAVFMKDFEDSYEKVTPMQQYFPSYQYMGYEQLRTYFTWRTKVRKGEISETSLSYVFLFIYELLMCIGVSSPEEGISKLLSFWREYRNFNDSIDKYVTRWILDYHIYYALPHSFREFAKENGISEFYPDLLQNEDDFSLFSSASKYNIEKSKFFTEENKELIIQCVNFTIARIRTLFSENEINFDEAVFIPVKNMPLWTPFKDALFHPWLRGNDRQVILSKDTVYICKNNLWTFSKTLTNESGKVFIGYILKQTESQLRKITGYKYKLSADIFSVESPALTKLSRRGVSLEAEINRAVSEFYREKTKIVVKVDPEQLSKIRKEASITQEKLTVPEEPAMAPPITPTVTPTVMPTVTPMEEPQKTLSFKEELKTSLAEDSLSGFDMLKGALSPDEIKTLKIILTGKESFEEISCELKIMPEVLADGINEKSLEHIGDNILDEEFNIYEDYEESIKEMVKNI